MPHASRQERSGILLDGIFTEVLYFPQSPGGCFVNRDGPDSDLYNGYNWLRYEFSQFFACGRFASICPVGYFLGNKTGNGRNEKNDREHPCC